MVVDSAAVQECSDCWELLVTRNRRLMLWLEGQALREIAATNSARGESAIVSGSFLPGGTHALFAASRAGRSQVATLATASLAGGVATPLAVTGARPMWSQGHLLFVRDGNLFAAPFDSKRN